LNTKQARETLVRLTEAQLDLSKAQRLTQVAQDAAAIAGVSVGEATESLSRAVSQLNPRLLRQYGIIVTLDEVYRKLEARTGRKMEDLTLEEKQTELLNLTLERGTRIAGTYAASQETIAQQLKDLGTQWEETKT